MDCLGLTLAGLLLRQDKTPVVDRRPEGAHLGYALALYGRREAGYCTHSGSTRLENDLEHATGVLQSFPACRSNYRFRGRADISDLGKCSR